jgi:hypothetical protein
MADEKPKEPTIWDFLKLNRPKTSGAGTRLLMGEKDPKSESEQLNEVIRLLLESAKTNPPDPSSGLGGLLAGTKSDIDYSQLLKWLQDLPTVKEAAQKKAAETNVVDSDLANQWLDKHWKKRNCAICEQVTWAMAPAFAHVPMELMGRGPAGTYQPVHSFPCVVLTCRICGNTLFFNAVAMDLLAAGAE